MRSSARKAVKSMPETYRRIFSHAPTLSSRYSPRSRDTAGLLLDPGAQAGTEGFTGGEVNPASP